MNTKINDGGPAFPMQEPQAIHSYAAAVVADIPYTEEGKRDAEYLKARGKAVGGMSLRDYFAATALQGMLANQHPYQASDEHMFARDAYVLADAMIRAREGGAQ